MMRYMAPDPPLSKHQVLIIGYEKLRSIMYGSSRFLEPIGQTDQRHNSARISRIAS